MRLIISGGGTGGHIYPALAIADEVMRRRPEAEVLYVGSDAGMEAEIVPRSGHRFEAVHISGLSRSSRMDALKALLMVPGALKQAMKIIERFRPHIVVGTGGYASYPVVAGAVHRGLRTYIHEQNALPGLANRRLAGRVDCVFLTFPEAQNYMKTANCRLTGFPVRKEIGSVTAAEARRHYGVDEGSFVLLVYGGSQGAMRINQAMLDFLKIAAMGEEMRIIWACGIEHYSAVERILDTELPSGIRSRIMVRDYIHDMPAALAAANLALCRAGAGTISELSLAGLPAILVPYPYAAENHQQKNAEAVASHGGAVMVPDSQMNGARLAELLGRLSVDSLSLEQMSRQMRSEAHPGALDEIVDILLS